MASDTSRKIFNSRKHYSGVLMQQGRVQLDSDWNEQLDIQQHRLYTETMDVIGESGVPKHSDSFKISSINASDLSISPGRIYVGGLLCELEEAATYLKQPYYPNPEGSFFSRASLSPPGTNLLEDGEYIVYIDAWQREVNHHDDPRIQEVALGEADTTARLQTVWQIKIHSIKVINADSKTNISEWNEITKPPTGKLKVQTVKALPTDNSCLLPPKSGYRRLENQHYRVEVHTGGNLNDNSVELTFKWSRDNASVETRILSISGRIVEVADMGKDDMLGFAPDQWVEIVDEASDLNASPNPLYKIASVDYGRREITLSESTLPPSSSPPDSDNRRMKLRRWDGTFSGLLKTSDAWLDLEEGIQVAFSSGTYRSGDYWHFPARTATGEVEWPPFKVPNDTPDAQLPWGKHHAYCKLAVLRVTGGVVNILDCRPKFPPLTAIKAEDVFYNNSICGGSNAQTVQQALDELCRRREGTCTLVAVPGLGWESVFAQIAQGADAQICFQVGEYPLSAAVNIANKGNIKLIGGGKGTRIVARNSEAALIFQNCSSVLIRDIYAETGKIGFSANDSTNNLNGTLSFFGCGEVQVDTVDLKCGAGYKRAATCLTVRDAKLVRISNCDLQIGNLQQGILLVNVADSMVQNNSLRLYARPSWLNISLMLRNNEFFAGLRKDVMADLRITNNRQTLGSRNVAIDVGALSVALKTPADLKNVMQMIIKESPPPALKNDRAMSAYLHHSVNRLFKDEAYRKRFSAFDNYFKTVLSSDYNVASQGITVGGILCRQVKITNNTLDGMMQGIHIGMSHNGPRNPPSYSNSINISDNFITIKIPVNSHKFGRHGIFIGNCKNLTIENNNVYLQRMPKANYVHIDGIRVWGIFGDRLMITKNHVASADEVAMNGFDVGIRVHSIKPIDRKRQQWVVMWNVAPSKQNPISVNNGVINLSGTNIP